MRALKPDGTGENISLTALNNDVEKQPLLGNQRPKKTRIAGLLHAAWGKTFFTSQRDPGGDGWQARLWVMCSRLPKQAAASTTSFLATLSTVAEKSAWRILSYFLLAGTLDILKFFQTGGQAGFNLAEGSEDESSDSANLTIFLIAASLVATTLITALTRVREINKNVAELVVGDTESRADRLPESNRIAIEYERIKTTWWGFFTYWLTRGGSFALNLATMGAKAWVGFLSGIILALIFKGDTPVQIASLKKGEDTYLPSQADITVWICALGIAAAAFFSCFFFDFRREERANLRGHQAGKKIGEWRKEGYDIYLFEELPLAKVCIAYADTYLFKAKTKELFFVRSDGTVMEMNIGNKGQLGSTLRNFFQDKKRIRLSSEQFAETITWNGGATPKSNTPQNASRKEKIITAAASFFSGNYAIASIFYAYASFAMASTVNIRFLARTHVTTPDSVNWAFAASGFLPILFSAGVDTKQMFGHFFLGQLPLNFKQAWSASFALLCCEFRCGVYQIIKNMIMTASIAILACLAGLDTYNNEEAVYASLLSVLLNWGCSDFPAKILSRFVAVCSMPGYFANNGWLAMLVLFAAWGLIPGELCSDERGITHVRIIKDEDEAPLLTIKTQPALTSINSGDSTDTDGPFYEDQKEQERSSCFGCC